MRIIGLLVALASPVLAQHVVVPTYPTGESQETIGTALQMACGRFVLTESIANARKLAGRVSTGYGGTVKVGMAIYPDLDNGPVQLKISSGDAFSDVDASTARVVREPNQTPASFTAGNTYRACACATGNAGAYAGPNWAGPYFPAMQNAFVASVGRAGNDCDPNGVPPSTTGVITPNTAMAPPILLISVE